VVRSADRRHAFTRELFLGEDLINRNFNYLDTTMTNSTMELDKNKTVRPAPDSGPLGAHPVGTGLGAVAGGAAAGAAAASVAGPVGTVIGAAAGAVVGALAGKGIAKMVDPTAEETYWRQNYSSRPYVANGATFDEYAPAYRYGVDSYEKYEGRSFEQAEPELMRDWDGAKGMSKLTWERAKHAARDSWQRLSDFVERATPGDSDRDGK
jgi:hypothetical protein